jgi:HlyD family secretion protein
MTSSFFRLGVVALAVVGIGLYATGHLPGLGHGAKSLAKSDPSAAPAISVAKVDIRDFIETVLITGSIVPRDEILVAPEVEGLRVLELNADEGDTVTKGQVLARLTSESLDAQMAQNEANIARASAAIAVANSGIVQAEASLKEARNAFDRAKPLKQQGYLSGATFDQRESAASNADSKLASARDGLRSAEADKAAFEAARRELTWKRGNAEVKSPADGIVSRRSARVGAVASAIGDPMFRIIARGELELDAEIAEGDIAKVSEQALAHVAVIGVGDVEGRVRLISSEVDKTTRLGKVKIFFGKNTALRLGAFGRGTIETARARGPAVPSSALIFTPDGATIQTVVENRVVTKRIKTGLKSAGFVEIREGLSTGDVIVVKAGSFLREGDVIRPIEGPRTLSEVK